MVRHRNRLCRKAVDALSLEVFKATLDGGLSGLLWGEATLPKAGDVELSDL